MKISVSLSEEDVSFLDEYARRRDRSRSAAVQEAVAFLRGRGLSDAYEQAWTEWDRSEDGTIWDSAVGDGA